MGSSADRSHEMVCGFRIVAPRWAGGALSGEGARKFGGRWNSPGRAVVYLGGSRALAALEMLVHLTTPASRSKPYRMIDVSIPRELVADYPVSALPVDWRTTPGAVTSVGDDWLKANGQLALRVPSVLIPEEGNLLVNPAHPDFTQLVAGDPAQFQFDPRM